MAGELNSKTERKQLRLSDKAKRFVEGLSVQCEKYGLVFPDGTEVNETTILTHSIENIFNAPDREQAGFVFVSTLGLREGFSSEAPDNYLLRKIVIKEALNGNGNGKHH